LSTRTLIQWLPLSDAMGAKLLETRKAVVAGWLGVATLLDRQGETALAAEVRQFVKTIPHFGRAVGYYPRRRLQSQRQYWVWQLAQKRPATADALST
jgi:hypothetical protein